ncbi:uncharacterized protein LOC134271003 [Saccostrea cucullata]|uniref:uncharacterized protein LOC134271003 n=1 Tax=Saccostrea cuccullata TaxID=36930 RepID=UPI002ED1193D
MKPVFAELRKFGHLNVIYIDDVLLLGNTKDECEVNLRDTVKSLDSLGFTIHPDKTQFYASQNVVFLGFLLDSVTMTVRPEKAQSIRPEKAQSIKEFCDMVLNQNEVTIKQVAQLVGMFVASEPGVEYARLYYKTLEIEKDLALKLNRGNFEAHMTISHQNSHIRLCMDNSVAVSYVNKQGGKISTLNELARELWTWCIDRNIWLSAEHVQGATNIIADSLSRKNVDMEWKLDEVVFDKLTNLCGKCEVDLFASKHNHQLNKYYSYTPDPNALGVDAFAHSWRNIDCYLFPPFSVISSVLKKIEEEEVQFALLIAPVWKTQPWFPQLMHQVAGPCFLLPKTETLLNLPKDPKRRHPLTKMKIAAFSLSGNACSVENYQEKLSILSADHGGNPQKDNIGVISKSGCSFVVKNRVIHLKQMLI